MSTAATATPWLHRRSTWISAAVVACLAAVALVVHLLGGSDGYSLDSAGLGSWTYLATALLVFGAICALLPGETTLNAAATLAAASWSSGS